MCCRPRPCSRPGLLSCLACQRGLPFSSRRAGLILAHSPSLSTSCCLRRSPSFPSPLPFHFLPPRSRFVGLPISTTVSLALSTSLFPLLVVNNIPSRSLCLFPCPRRVCDFLVSLRFRGGPWWYPVPSITQVFGSPGHSLPSWPVSLTACGLLSSPAAGSSVGVGPLLFLCPHFPPLPPMSSVPLRALRHLVTLLRPGPCTLVLPSRHPGPNGCHFWASIVPCTVYLPES